MLEDLVRSLVSDTYRYQHSITQANTQPQDRTREVHKSDGSRGLTEWPVEGTGRDRMVREDDPRGESREARMTLQGGMTNTARDLVLRRESRG